MEEQHTPSSIRELAVIEKMLEGDLVNDNTNVIYFTDNSAVVLWCRYGSMKKEQAKALQRIEFLKLSRNIILTVSWRPRTDKIIRKADETLRYK